MSKLTVAISLVMLVPAAWAADANPGPTAAIPAHGTATATAGTNSTALTSAALLQRYDQATGQEATTLLAQYHAQEEALFQQRATAYEQMNGKSPDERRQIWVAMIAQQRAALAEHRALGLRLNAALKDEKEKAAAAELAAPKNGGTPIQPR
ncbi:MAG TPA: hypothetical protein VG838_07845 [Opitutaceae bacterium]|nr:hypothetical protein [Opitutaceae bacterium]